MSNLVTEGVVSVAQAVSSADPVSPWVNNSTQIAKFVIDNVFVFVGGVFSVVFIILVFTVFVKALKGTSVSDLFRDGVDRNISPTKFWTNVAYFTATVAFIDKIFMTPGMSDSQNTLIVIYLAGVGSNAIASQWLGLKYRNRYPNGQSTDVGYRYDQYNPVPQRQYNDPDDYPIPSGDRTPSGGAVTD